MTFFEQLYGWFTGKTQCCICGTWHTDMEIYCRFVEIETEDEKWRCLDCTLDRARDENRK